MLLIQRRPKKIAGLYGFFFPVHTYVAELDNKILGTYILRKNQQGLGAHVANAAYMVHPDAREHGIGKAMGTHSIRQAKSWVFLQYNLILW